MALPGSPNSLRDEDSIVFPPVGEDENLAFLHSDSYDDELDPPLMQLMCSPNMSRPLDGSCPLTRHDGELEELWRHRRDTFLAEQRFLQYLDTLIKLFAEPLAFKMRTDDHQAVFNAYKRLRKVVKGTLSLLAANESLAHVFSSIGPLVDGYASVLYTFPEAIWTMARCLSSPRLRAFVTQQEQQPECARTTLLNLMCKPIQRLERYRQMFNMLLLECTQPGEVEFVQGVMEQLNELTESQTVCSQELRKYCWLLDVEAQIGVTDVVSDLPRDIIKEGVLYQRSSGRAFNSRTCWLLDDLVLITRDSSGAAPKKPLYILPMSSTQVAYLNTGEIELTCGKLRVQLTAAIFADLASWLDALCRVMDSQPKHTHKRPPIVFKDFARSPHTWSLSTRSREYRLSDAQAATGRKRSADTFRSNDDERLPSLLASNRIIAPTPSRSDQSLYALQRNSTPLAGHDEGERDPLVAELTSWHRERLAERYIGWWFARTEAEKSSPCSIM